jgi:hypothetical protein
MVAKPGFRRRSISVRSQEKNETRTDSNKLRSTGFIQFLRHLNISIITVVPIIVGLLIIYLGTLLASPINGESASDRWGAVVSGLGALVMGLAPLLTIWRKETYGVGKSIHGWPAVVSGIIGLLFIWGIAFRLFLHAIFGI